MSPHIQTALWRRRGWDEPRGILAGLRGQRGKDVRRTVYDSTLRMEDGAHAVVRGVLAEYLLGNAATAMATSGGGRNAATAVTAMAALSQRGFWQRSDMAMIAGDGRLEYRRKVDCLRLSNEIGKEARIRRSNKGSKCAADDDREGGAGKKWQRIGGS